ncbi:MAG: zinc ribbon domain-containing protein [Prevotella sp.]|nr:zinc ribbon domain-containing protein [Prevotella sp.]MBO5156703.1 zinc ribbon domain-containing protein [Prevotella sp.]
MKRLPVITFLAIILTLSSCYHPHRSTSDAWDIAESDSDTISFNSTSHYAPSYNFIIKADSLTLPCQSPKEQVTDSVTFYNKERVVVADIMTVQGDSIDSVWVKIARDQFTMGWAQETVLLDKVRPDDPISQFIDVFSDTHLLIFLALVVVVAAAYGLRKLVIRHVHIVHFYDINTIYPTLLTILVSASATFYSSIQLFDSESWRHFYYHPSLNPFDLPIHLALFISSVWAIIIMIIAVFDEVYKRLPVLDASLYIFALAAVCAVDYVVFSITTLYYIGYPLLAVYTGFALWKYIHVSATPYLCGRCGKEIHRKGRCPHCGAMNE